MSAMENEKKIKFDILLRYAFSELSKKDAEKLESDIHSDSEAQEVLSGIEAYALDHGIESAKEYRNAMRKEQLAAKNYFREKYPAKNLNAIPLYVGLLIVVFLFLFPMIQDFIGHIKSDPDKKEEILSVPEIDSEIVRPLQNIPVIDAEKTLRDFYERETAALRTAGPKESWQEDFLAGDLLRTRQVLDSLKERSPLEEYLTGTLHLLVTGGSTDSAYVHLTQKNRVRSPFNDDYSIYLLIYLEKNLSERAKEELSKNPAYRSYYSKELLNSELLR